MRAGNILRTVITLLLTISGVQSYVTQTIDLHGCQGRRIPMDECFVRGSKMRVESVTIYATPNSTKIGLSSCFAIQDCARTIHSGDDMGLTDDFQYLYKWIVHKCEGKPLCDHGVLPQWTKLTGDFSHVASSRCPKLGTKYFTAVQAHISCVAHDFVPTKPPPPDTTPRTPPSTPSGTTGFAVYVPIYTPELIGREKVFLGVAIGLSLSILILILITLYCCERYKRQRKLGLLQRMLGAPQADHEAYIDDLDDYRKPDESWDRFNYNPDCIAEYSGVKPNEYVTLDRKSLEHSRQYISTETSLYATNSCSTLNRSGYHRDLWHFYGQTNHAFQEEMKFTDSIKERSQSVPRNPSPTKPLSYDSFENIEMERRMAAALGTPGSLTRTVSDSHKHAVDEHLSDCSDSDSDILTVSSRTITCTEVSDLESEHLYSDCEGDDLSEEDNYSNDNRELHVIVEDHAEEEHEERISDDDDRQISDYSSRGEQCWNTGLQWRVEVKYDGIGKATSQKSKLDRKRESNSQTISPTHYKCEIRAYDTEISELA